MSLSRLFNARHHHLNLILDSVECTYIPTPCMSTSELKEYSSTSYSKFFFDKDFFTEPEKLIKIIFFNSK